MSRFDRDFGSGLHLGCGVVFGIWGFCQMEAHDPLNAIFLWVLALLCSMIALTLFPERDP